MDFDVIIKAGSAIGEPKTIGEGRYAVVPEGYETEDLEKYLAAPLRARGTVTAHTVPTFTDYFNRFKTAESAIFADQDKARVVGVLDYHGPGKPAFREHSVAYTAPKSKEWQTWRAADGKKMQQADFAVFIENNVIDIRQPTGADVLEVSRSLQATKNVTFNSAIRLADGSQQLTYSETVDGSTKQNNVKVPETFILGVPVYFGGILYEVTARLRYRIHEGKLLMWFDLFRPEHIEQDAFAQVVEEVAKGTTSTVWMGVA